MKKSISFLFCILMCVGQLSAQNGINQKRSKSKNLITNSKAVIVGLKGGVDLAGMSYTSSELKSLSQDLYLRPAAGLFVEFPLSKSFAVGADFLYQGRGMKVNYFNGGDERYPVNYKISSNYFDLRIPLTYRFLTEKMVNPYVFLAPDFSMLAGGAISLDQKSNLSGEAEMNQTIDIGEANMRPYSVSAIFGVGARLNLNFRQFALIMKLDVAYNFGLVNTYSDKEMNHGFGNQPYNENIVNVNAYTEIGSRFNRGPEIMFSIGLPLKFMRDACSGFGNRKYKSSF